MASQGRVTHSELRARSGDPLQWNLDEIPLDITVLWSPVVLCRLVGICVLCVSVCSCVLSQSVERDPISQKTVALGTC